MQTLSPESTPERSSPVRRLLARAAISVIVIGFATFWIWALFFASKDAVNKIDDRAWAVRAEEICAVANAERLELSDYRSIVDVTPELIRERADIVDRATDVVERMIDDVTAVQPTDEKGQGIVPLWRDEYREYIAQRRAYADQLRESGENLAFYEPGVDGLPISERLETFAGDNDMPSCAPPRDLSR